MSWGRVIKTRFARILCMARQVRHLSDIPSRRKFGSKYGGRVYRRDDWNWGRSAGKGLREAGKRLKNQGRIQGYRVVSYEDVRITKGRHGSVDDRRKKVYVLYTRR